MSFRKFTLPSGVVSALTKPTEEHTKLVDYSANRIRELAGVHPEDMAHYNGEECICVFDTETTCETGDNFGKPLIYDLGATFIRKSEGVPVGKASFIVSDIFCNAKLMKAAFFTNRVFTDYPYILSYGFTNLVNYETMLRNLSCLFVKYNVKTIAAYNSNFDTKALIKTADYIEREFNESCRIGLVADLELGQIDVLDLWALSCMTFMSHDDYKEQAFKHGWYTKNKDKFSTNAEAANNYINSSEVGEDHTALSDSAIEAGIYKFCLSQPDFAEIYDLCLNGHGETWAYVNNQGAKSVESWVQRKHPEKLAEYQRLVAER